MNEQMNQQDLFVINKPVLELELLGVFSLNLGFLFIISI